MAKYQKKPFPWNCSNCRQQAVYGAVVDYVGTEYHDGHAYSVKIDGLKTPKCVNCGQTMLDIEALDVITAAFIRQINLLPPEQIQEHRLKAKLTQHELAAAIGVADFVVEQLEQGYRIQSRSLDNLLRLFFGLPQVREILTTQQISTLAQEPVAPSA
jgi:DNA-binding transcriptional regulator YiaG